MRQHCHRINAKKGVKFNSKQADWCTHQNLQMMYTEVYQQMVSSGIAHKLNTPVWLNNNSKIVELEEEAFGLKTEYLLCHLSKLIFTDEVRSNTSQTKDGNCGGKKFVVPNDV